MCVIILTFFLQLPSLICLPVLICFQDGKKYWLIPSARTSNYACSLPALTEVRESLQPPMPNTMSFESCLFADRPTLESFFLRPDAVCFRNKIKKVRICKNFSSTAWSIPRRGAMDCCCLVVPGIWSDISKFKFKFSEHT